MPLAGDRFCLVIDDALVDPESLVDWAARQRVAFQRVDFNAYPGNYLMAPVTYNDALRAFFIDHIRGLFDARRLLQMHCRLSMVTLAPRDLRPYQWLCHSDNFGLEHGLSIQACVLYLFRDESLGGTGFYVPVRAVQEVSRLFADSTALSAAAFSDRYGIEPGYMLDSNAYFKRIGGVPARWNRLIFYDGSMLHSGDIRAPDKLDADPQSGRLTFNGFFTCRRRAM